MFCPFDQPARSIVIEKSVAKIFPHHMEAEVSLSASHDPWPSPELDDCTPLLTLCNYLISISILAFNLRCSSKLSLPSRFLNVFLTSSMRVTCGAHLILCLTNPVKLHIKKFSAASLYFLPLIPHNILFRNTVSGIPAVRIQIMGLGVETPCCLVSR